MKSCHYSRLISCIRRLLVRIIINHCAAKYLIYAKQYMPRGDKKASEYDQEYHNNTSQTNPRHR